MEIAKKQYFLTSHPTPAKPSTHRSGFKQDMGILIHGK